ncbi:hypothetical protein EH68_01440 [Enterococcus gallinarum]|nr:DUF1642 domain-containing protein [Enterococcus gallinarum]KIL83026.1 hypothetical protein EH68_01440 [Enterococcus gallinarum]
MNKQELIDVLKNYKNGYQEQKDGYFKGAYGAYGVALNLVKKLDEQPKVTVPQFLAKFIQDNKGNSASDIFSQDWFHESVDEADDEVNKWLYDNDTAENDRRYLIAVQAFVTGEYEVEKEPLYQIELPGTSWGAYLTKADNGDLVIFQNTTSGSAFTESEIKAIDERYWAFAVPVEEVK